MDGIARLFSLYCLCCSRLPQASPRKGSAEVREPSACAKSKYAEIERDWVERRCKFCWRTQRHPGQRTYHRNTGQHKIAAPLPSEYAEDSKDDFRRAN